MLIEWTDEWLVGEERIDSEHRETVWLINRLYTAAECSENIYTLTKIMISLVEITKEHFSYEERLMFAMHYPTASEHRRQHQYLLSTINVLGDTISENNTDLGSINALNSWFVLHTTIEDASLGKFLKFSNSGTDNAEDLKSPGKGRLNAIRERLKKADRTQAPPNVWDDIEWLISEIDRLKAPSQVRVVLTSDAQCLKQ